jgi:hypothetical protein
VLEREVHHRTAERPRVSRGPNFDPTLVRSSSSMGLSRRIEEEMNIRKSFCCSIYEALFNMTDAAADGAGADAVEMADAVADAEV